jgi:terminal uridylyltransferase
MAYVSVHSAQSMSSSQQQASSQRPSLIVPHVDKQRFVVELSQCLLEFVLQLLPTSEEMAVKEDVRKLLERLIRTIEPDSRLLSFGSTANGFSLRNSGSCLSYSLLYPPPPVGT